jgi:hypothetical protein
MNWFHARLNKDASRKRELWVMNQDSSKQKKLNSQDLGNITVFSILRVYQGRVAYLSPALRGNRTW